MYHKGELIDKKVSEIAQQVSLKIDCTQCANCCKTLHPDVSVEEATRLAQIKNMSEDVFIKKYLHYNAATSPNLYFKDKPCKLLCNNLCTVYNNRPTSCKGFPYLDKENFKLRYKRIMQFYNMCPIIFNTIEILKKDIDLQQ